MFEWHFNCKYRFGFIILRGDELALSAFMGKHHFRVTVGHWAER